MQFDMNGAIFGLAIFAAFLAIMATIGFVRIARKPAEPRDLTKDWLGNDPL
jgi:hypothetical protein